MTPLPWLKLPGADSICADILGIIESILADTFDFMENIDPDILDIHTIVHAYTAYKTLVKVSMWYIGY
jgi:hypothetical protein